jgi:hypothetical protein
MAFLAPVAAELGGWTLRKVLPWALLGLAVAGLDAALWVENARLGAAKTALQSALHDRDMAQADAKRWAGSAGQLQKVIDSQAAQLTHQAADLVTAEQVADDTAQAQAIEISSLANQIETLKARAHAHPDQVRPLGPIVTDVLGSLYKAGSGGPATAPAGS